MKTINSSIYFLFLFLQSKLSQPQMHIVSDLEGMGLRHFVYMIQVVLVRVFICKSQSTMLHLLIIFSDVFLPSPDDLLVNLNESREVSRTLL